MMTKKNFLEVLQSLDREDIDKLIKEKGKPRKTIRPFIHLEDGDEILIKQNTVGGNNNGT